MPRFFDLRNKNKRVVLLLQGGGALGAYQVGAYEALHKALIAAGRTGVDWVGGISIGAVNAAVIAAPKQHKYDPAAELDTLWKEILPPAHPPFDFMSYFGWLPLGGYRMKSLIPKWIHFSGLAWGPLGLPNFFSPKPVWLPWLTQWVEAEEVKQLGFYDTRQLAATLDRHVCWNQLGRGTSKGRRLLLGVTSAMLGELQLLDSYEKPEHAARDQFKFLPVRMNANCVRASGALPPAFPPVRLKEEIRRESLTSERQRRLADEDAFLDGGVASNTLITELEDELATQDTIVFLIDLWDRKGDVPQTMDEIVWRQKCIQFGSRKKSVEQVLERHQLRMERMGRNHTPGKHKAKLEVCHLMYESTDKQQFAFSDADFCTETYRRLHSQGVSDMEKMLRDPYQIPVAGEVKPIDDPHWFAVLYRRGSASKHLMTDTGFKAMQTGA